MRRRTPTILQQEAAECGVAALAMLLASHGRWVPLEELSLAAGVKRDGLNVQKLVAVARGYGLQTHEQQCDVDALANLPFPVIAFWNSDQCVVLEGFGR